MNGIKHRTSNELKYSGIEWIGMIPSDWEIIKLKYLAHCLDGIRIPLSATERGEMSGDFEYWGANGIVDYVNEYIIDEEVILLGEDGAPFFDKDKDVAFLINRRIWVNNHIHILKSNGFDSRTILYNLNRTDYADYIEGSTRDKLTQGAMMKIPIVTPSNGEESRVNNFLDCKTVQFDSIIAKKAQLIAKLEEAKKSLISEVVTGKVKIVDGRLVPRQPEEMKDSGFEVLGYIPHNWEVKRNRHVFNERNIKSTNKTALLLSVSRYLGVIMQSEADELELATIAPAESMVGYKTVKKNDLVMNIMRAKDGSFGVSKYDGVTSPAYCIYKCAEFCNPTFLFYLFKTQRYINAFENFSTGIAEHRMRLYPENFYEIFSVVPPLSVQNEIVEMLDQKIKRFDEYIVKNRNQINNIKSARQSLISEAVTGKIDLRDWEITDQGGAS